MEVCKAAISFFWLFNMGLDGSNISQPLSSWIHTSNGKNDMSYESQHQIIALDGTKI